MSGTLCVWANLPDEALEWYEDEYIPDMRTQNAIHALHCERTTNGFEEDPIGQSDLPWPLCTIYEVKDVQKATAGVYDKRNYPPDELRSGPLAKARFDVRTYRELKRWQSEGWNGSTYLQQPFN